MSAFARHRARMTVDEFMVWDSGDPYRYELVDGEPRCMAPASIVHGHLQNEIGAFIRSHLRARGMDCDVVANPGVVPHLLAAHNFRVPDIGVTRAPIQPGVAGMAEPILLVEVLSPRNESDTWSNVWTYTTIPSLREILIVQSVRIGAELIRRLPNGDWPKEAAKVPTDELFLESIDFRMPLRDLYARAGLGKV